MRVVFSGGACVFCYWSVIKISLRVDEISFAGPIAAVRQLNLKQLLGPGLAWYALTHNVVLVLTYFFNFYLFIYYVFLKRLFIY